MSIRTDSFSCTSYHYNSREFKAEFHFQLIHDGAPVKFTEYLQFPQHDALTAAQQKALNKVLFALHLVLGISYWKLFCPQHIEILSGELTQAGAQFWNTVYTIGLGEFYYRNQIDFRSIVSMPCVSTSPSPVKLLSSQTPLVAFGGGKDSLVSIELFKKYGSNPQIYAVHQSHLHEGLIAVMKKTHMLYLNVIRHMDPQLVNPRLFPGHYSGHIPISIVYAFVGCALSIMHSCGYVVASNESSANSGNTMYLGHEVNHQWSKSFDAERLMNTYLQTQISPQLHYFSLLRPYTELAIAKEFSRYPRYFDSFSSCNKNFVLDADSGRLSWCLSCAKCVFSALLLAAFLPRPRVVEFMGGDVFTKESSILYLKGLLGVEMKPFDCVGTPEEVAAALMLIHEKKEYDDTLLMASAQALMQFDSMKPPGRILTERFLHAIPSQFAHIVLS